MSLPTSIICHIPAGIQSRQALFDALAVGLRLPEYFGRNWDALHDCLGDLEWLPPGVVEIRHEDVPLAADPEGRRTYLELLREAAELRASTPFRRLKVVFPSR
jgi:RNAse (barnase) inhibitor barstar